MLPIGKLELNTGQIEGLPKNPRFIRDDRFTALVKSIQDAPEMLRLRELLVVEHGNKFVVIGGNMRMRACKELGMTEVPCKVLPAETPTEKLREYAIKDNNAFGETDWEIITNEWNTAELQDWGFEIPADWAAGVESETQSTEVVEDDFDEDAAVEPVCKPGEIWKLGRHRLMCGDSTDAAQVARLMDGELADLWLTDPPYNVAIQNSKGMTIKNDNMEDAKFTEFLIKAFKAAVPVMKTGCPFYVWYATRTHTNFERALNTAGLKVKQQLIWNKSHFVLGRSHYQWKHEPCMYGWKGDSCRYFTAARNHATVIEDEKEIDIDKMKKDELRDMLARILESPIPTTVINEKTPVTDSEHPTMKPVRLFGYQIENSTLRGGVVLDTFGGSGTTAIACEQLNREARLMELDPHYCDVIIARWEKFTGLKAEKLNT